MSAGEELRTAAKNLRNIPKNIEEAQLRTLKKVARQTKTEVSRVIRSEVSLKKDYVDSKIQVTIATLGNNTIKAIISAEKRGMLLTRLPYRQLKRGIKVQTKKGRWTTFEHAFIVALNTQYNAETTAIATRMPPQYLTWISGTRRRAPIDVKHGPSVSQIFSTFLPQLQTYAVERYDIVMKQELRYLLRVK